MYMHVTRARVCVCVCKIYACRCSFVYICHMILRIAMYTYVHVMCTCYVVTCLLSAYSNSRTYICIHAYWTFVYRRSSPRRSAILVRG